MRKLLRAKFYALRFLRGEPIPLFASKAMNFAIDQAVNELVEARRRHIWRRRKALWRGGRP